MSINVQQIKDVIIAKREVLQGLGQLDTEKPVPFVSEQDKVEKEVYAMQTRIVKLEGYNIETVSRRLNSSFDEARKLVFKVLEDDYKARQKALKDEHPTR